MSFQSLTLIFFLFAFEVHGRAAPNHAQVTPAAALVPRQTIAGSNCGFIDANVLSPLGCQAGFSCTANPTYNVAGGCCRLGDANCQLATSCVAQASLSSLCDSACSSNQMVSKCSDSASPYCYTRYWITGGNTPTEIGCTNTQGYFAYVYTTYTGFGATIGGGIATSSPVAPSSTGTVASATGSSGTGSSGSSSQNSSGGSGSSSPPAGAIAGGVVGGLVVIGIIVLLAVWLILRHRRQTKAAGSNSKAVAPDEPSSGTAQGVTSGPPKTSEATVQDAGVHEIAQNDRVHELNNNQKYPELP